MDTIKIKTYPKFFFIILLLAMLIFVFLIIKPFLITIFTSIILSYIFYPLYESINRKLKSRNLSSIITTIIVIIVIAVPIIFATNAIAKEARVNYIFIKQKIITGDIVGSNCDTHSPLCRISQTVRERISEPRTKYYIDNANEKITSYIINNISNFLLSIPLMILNIFIILFIMFHVFKDGKQLFKKIEKLSPLKKLHYKRIFKRFNDVIYAVVFGYIIVALIEGILSSLIFVVLGVRAPILLGLIIAFLALIPVVGPPIVWIPLALLMIIEGYTTQLNVPIIKGIILLLYGTLIITPIDTILKPKIIGDKARVHPVLVLLGVLGGLKMFGFIGIIIGPVVLAIFMTFLKIYEEEKGVLLQ